VAALMAVRDGGDLQKLLALAPVQRNVLLALPADTLQALAGGTSITQLAMLANRMLEPQQSPTAIAQIAEDVAQGNITVEELTTPVMGAAGAGVSASAGSAGGSAGGAGSAGAATGGAGAGGSAAASQGAPGLQRDSENGNIRVLGILAVLAILAAAGAVAVGYLQRRKAQRS
jgi:cobalamin biosynthesis Mg chelatase CobN